MTRRIAFNFAALTTVGLLLNQCHTLPPSHTSMPKLRSASIPSSLIIELRNARSLPGKTPAITIDFMMKNNTNQTMTLAKRWNSWGAYQWEYEITDATGKKFKVVNPQWGWGLNCFDVLDIKPGSELQLPSFLDYGHNYGDFSFHGDKNYFVDERNILVGKVVMGEKGISHRVQLDYENAWKYPVTVVGKFTAKLEEDWDNRTQKIRHTNWAGSITTAPITVEAPTAP